MIRELRRVATIVFIFVMVLLAFLNGYYELFASPIQLLMLKTLLVSAGLLLAHVARKALFPKIDLSNDNNWQSFLIVLSFYLIIPYCFAMGG